MLAEAATNNFGFAAGARNVKLDHPVRQVGRGRSQGRSPSCPPRTAASEMRPYLPAFETFARPLSSSLFDAIWPDGVVKPFDIISLNRNHALEDCRVVRQRYFLDSFLPAVDRFGTRKEKHHSSRFLGVQRTGQSPGLELFCHLSSRFRWRADDFGAFAPVLQKSVFEMARGVGGQEGKKALRCTEGIRDRCQLKSWRSKTTWWFMRGYGKNWPISLA